MRYRNVAKPIPIRSRLQTGEEFRRALRLGKSPMQGFRPGFCGTAAQRPTGLTSAEISQYPVTILDACFLFTSSPHLATSDAALRLFFPSWESRSKGGSTPASYEHQKSLTQISSTRHSKTIFFEANHGAESKPILPVLKIVLSFYTPSPWDCI